MPPFLPTQSVAALGNCIPGLHRGSGIVVAHRGISLDVKKRSAVGTGSAETDSLNSELRHDVIAVGIFIVTVHCEAREGDCDGIDQRRTQDFVPGDISLLSKVVVK